MNYEHKMISEYSKDKFNKVLNQHLVAGWELVGELSVQTSSASSYDAAWERTDSTTTVVYSHMLRRLK
jgi:hypothetical protein